MKRRSDLYSNPPAIKRAGIQSVVTAIRPLPPSITFVRPATASTATTSNSSSNINNNMTQKIESLEAMVKKVVDENVAFKEDIANLMEQLTKSNERIDELETIIKNRRHKVATDTLFKSSPEILAETVEVRFLQQVATFPLKEYINFDMEDKALDEVAKLIAIKMFEQMIPEGHSLVTFSTSSTPRYGYITIPSNLFEELADKLVKLTVGHEDNNLKHAILLRINFGLNDKIQRTRKHYRHSNVPISDANSTDS